ncbi:MAG TPA: MMPL family transporter [Candidatus Binatia bacterium]|nr:MMPL family transporter [Candidatus Binatia bacterium]
MSRFAECIVGRPRVVLAGIALLTFAALWALTTVALDNSTERLLVRDSDAWRFLVGVRQSFGGDETLFVLLREPDVLAPPAVRRLQAITEAVAHVPEVERTLSLTNLRWPWPENGDVAVQTLFGPDGRPTEGAPLAAALAHPLVARNLVSPDHTIAGVLALVSPHPEDPRFKGRLVAHVEAAVAAAAPGADVVLGGAPYAQVVLNMLTGHDMGVLAPAMLVVMGIVLFLTYRSAHAVWLPLVTVFLSLVWTVALAGVFGRSLSIVTSVLPPLIIAIGTSYTIRVLSEYARQHPSADPRTALVRALAEVGSTVLLCGATTALGFASLLTSRVEVIRDLGLLATCGSGFTTFAALTVVPATLALLPARVVARPRAGIDARLKELLPALHAFTMRQRRPIVAASLALTAVGFVGLTRLAVDQDPYDWFPAGSSVARSTEMIDDALGGIVPLGVVIESPDGVYDPMLFRAADAVARHLRSEPEVRSVVSPADHLALMHAAFRTASTDGRLPATRALTAQYLLLFDTSDSETLAPYVSEQSRRVQVVVRLAHASSRRQKAFVARLQEDLRSLVPAPLRATITGTGLLRLETNDAFTAGLFQHLLLASLAIAVLLGAALRSARLGGLALVPNLVPILFVYGILGWLGIPLNAATVTTGAAALGNAVDDTVQYLDRYRRCRAAGLAGETACGETLAAVGSPMIASDVVLTVGFGLLLLSSFFPVASLGLLGASGMALSLVANLFVLPILTRAI